MANPNLPYRTQPDYWNGSSDAAASALGFGTSSARHQLGTAASQNGLGLFFETEATTGDARGINLRLYFSGAGGSGEALRAYGIVNGVSAATGGTVNGAHITLEITGSGGAVSGAGNAIRASLAIAAGLTPGGTLAGIQIDSQFGSAAVQGTPTAAIRVNDTGAVGWHKLFNLPAVASAGLVAAHTTQTMSHSIRIIAGATVLYLMCTDTVTNRTGGA